MHAVVGVEVGDDDPMRIHAALPHQLSIQVAATPGHRAALADHDPRLERIEDVDELRECAAELGLEGLHVGDAGLVRLARDDRADLALRRPLRIGESADGVPQLLERLGVGRDEGQVDQVVRRWWRLRQRLDRSQLRQLAPQPPPLPTARTSERDDAERLARQVGAERREAGFEDRSAGRRIGEAGKPLGPVDGKHVADPSEGDDHRAAEPERAAQPVEVEAQDEVGDQPRIAEAEPERQDQDCPGDRAGDHLEEAAQPAQAIGIVAGGGGHRGRTGRTAGRGREPAVAPLPPSRPVSASRGRPADGPARRRSRSATGSG